MQQGSGRLVYYAFDCLEVDGAAGRRPAARGAARAAGRADRAPSATVQPLGGVRGRRGALRGGRARRGSRGSSRSASGSRYAQGRRTRDWLKVKTHGRQEFVIAGYTRGHGAPLGARSARSSSPSTTAASSGTPATSAPGSTSARSPACSRLLRPLERPESPFARAAEDAACPPRRRHLGRAAARRRGRVQRVDARRARAPALYKGLREDKAPSEVRHERPPADVVRVGKRELTLSNLDKLFWPDEGITKGDLLEYYRAVAPVLVPHLKGRPFTMRRYPDGAFGKAFFQKDAPSHMPAWIRTFATEVTTRSKERAQRTVSFPVVDDELALLWMVNMGCIDMNPWYSRVDRPDRPDFVLFDLDPTPEVPYAADCRGGAAPEGRCSTASASTRSRRRRAARASTCSCRSTAARPTRTPARSPSTSRARSRGPIRSSRRPRGRSRSAAAC